MLAFVWWVWITGDSQSRDKVGVELLTAPISNKAAGYGFLNTVISLCLTLCLTDCSHSLSELKRRVFIPSWRWGQCFDVKYNGSLLWKHKSFLSCVTLKVKAWKAGIEAWKLWRSFSFLFRQRTVVTVHMLAKSPEGWMMLHVCMCSLY